MFEFCCQTLVLLTFDFGVEIQTFTFYILETKVRNTTFCPQFHYFTAICLHLTPVSLCSHAKFEDLCLVFQ